MWASILCYFCNKKTDKCEHIKIDEIYRPACPTCKDERLTIEKIVIALEEMANRGRDKNKD